MSDEAAKADGAVTETPPIELLEKAVADMLDGRNIDANYWDVTLRDFRKVLDAARRENIWAVVDLAFGNIVGVSYEMLLRSQLAMRLRLEYLTQRRGADYLPNIREYAERVERVARLLLEAAERYAKVRHVTHLARRRDDPKVVYIDEAQRGSAAAGKTGKGAPRKRAARKKA